MPRNNQKDSQIQESDDDREIGSPHDRDVDDAQLDERAPQKAGVNKKNEEEQDNNDVDENDLDDLSAMEGPDA